MSRHKTRVTWSHRTDRQTFMQEAPIYSSLSFPAVYQTLIKPQSHIPWPVTKHFLASFSSSWPLISSAQLQGNHRHSRRLRSRPLKNKITKNKVITTWNLCPIESTDYIPSQLFKSLHLLCTRNKCAEVWVFVLILSEESRSHGWNGDKMSHRIIYNRGWRWTVFC